MAFSEKNLMHVSAMPGMPNMSAAEMSAVGAQSAPVPAPDSQSSAKPVAAQAPGVGGNLDITA